MTREHWIYIGAGVALLLVISGGGAAVVSVVRKRGSVIGPNAGTDGWVNESPASLAASAGLEVDVLSLARCLSSEVGGLPDSAQAAVGWAVRNQAARTKKTITDLLCGKAGKYGGQNAGPGRYAATSRAPLPFHVEWAKKIIAGTVPDPTGGATLWDSPRAQDALVARAAKGYKKTATMVASDRMAAGYAQVTLSDVPSATLRLWRKTA